MKNLLKQMIKIVEFQTIIGTKLQSLEREIKAVHDKLDDLSIKWEK